MYTSIRISKIFVALLICLLTGCEAGAVSALVTETPTSSVESATSVPVVIADRTLQSVPDLAQADDSSQRLGACESNDEIPIVRTAHRVSADVFWAERRVTVEQTVRYTNHTDAILNEIVFNVEPNRWNNVFILGAVRSLDEDMPVNLDGKRLMVGLLESLGVGCQVELVLSYALNMPLIGSGIYATHGYLGYTNRQFNLGHWLAAVAPYQDGDWISRQSFLVGEQDVLDTADWDVTLNMIGAEDNLTIAAPGEMTSINPQMRRYRHDNARDFSLSISDNFRVISAEALTGVTVEVYSYDDALVNVNGQQFDTAQIALDEAVRAIETYSDLFGTYPYSRLVIVQGDFPDGMEFSGFVHVGSNWFTRYPGNVASYLVLITVHEVAHQWWYARTGNDAAQDPWLDEAFATYSEYIFLEEHYPELRDWWWGFRINNYSPTGDVDSTIYEFNESRPYINAVYLRGSLMLHAIRQIIGTEAFFDLINAYAETSAGEIASPNLFWSLMSDEQFELTRNIRELYLGQIVALP